MIGSGTGVSPARFDSMSRLLGSNVLIISLSATKCERGAFRVRENPFDVLGSKRTCKPAEQEQPRKVGPCWSRAGGQKENPAQYSNINPGHEISPRHFVPLGSFGIVRDHRPR